MNAAKFRALALAGLLLPLDCLVAVTLLLADLATLPLRARHRVPVAVGSPDVSSVTIQILNWDGRHLLEECLPRVLEAVRQHTEFAGGHHEVLVVDNGSRDGSIEFLKERFPEVRIMELDRNYGFSIGNNRGFERVRTDIVILLNNDMLVSSDFIEPLLKPFSAADVFAVSSQISFADLSRRREETGKTRARFEKGFFHLWHDEIRLEDESREAMPVFWAGGGSCAIDRRKLAHIGGLDTLYHPFYVEDTDMSYQAWKRGWTSLLAPGSRVVHKHRGTSRPKFGDAFVDSTIRRNQYLFVWKNLTEPGMILQHLAQLPRIHASAIMQKGARFEFRAFARALRRLPLAIERRLTNVSEYSVSDREVLKLSQ